VLFIEIKEFAAVIIHDGACTRLQEILEVLIIYSDESGLWWISISELLSSGAGG
jgi:hypothetical protein